MDYLKDWTRVEVERLGMQDLEATIADVESLIRYLHCKRIIHLNLTVYKDYVFQMQAPTYNSINSKF